MVETIKPRVLIVDDAPVIVDTINQLITNLLGYEVVAEAGNGREAVDIFNREKPDLVLLDINMPVKSGKEALKEIMSQDPKALVIMLTSLDDIEIVEECISLGAANYILKGTPLMDMKDIIRDTWQANNQ